MSLGNFLNEFKTRLAAREEVVLNALKHPITDASAYVMVANYQGQLQSIAEVKLIIEESLKKSAETEE